MPASPSALYARLLGRARLRHLQLLVAVNDHGTLMRAAAHVGMSQPAATQAIGELERLLELPLFDRQPRGMRLSEAGQVLLPVVRQVLQALERSLQAMAALDEGARGLLRVGAIPAAMVRLVEASLPVLAERHPRLQLQVFESTPTQLLNELAAGGLDMILTRAPPDLGARFCFEPLASDEAVVIAGPGHPLADRSRVSLEDLVAYPWMSPPPGVRVRDLLDELFGGGARPTLHPVSTSSPMLVAALLADNRTLSLGPASVAGWFVRHGKAVRLAWAGAPSLVGLGAVYPVDEKDRPAVAAFLDMLRAGAAQAVPGTRLPSPVAAAPAAPVAPVAPAGPTGAKAKRAPRSGSPAGIS
jgi:molybdate transport repressor ModE-like protein